MLAALALLRGEVVLVDNIREENDLVKREIGREENERRALLESEIEPISSPGSQYEGCKKQKLKRALPQDWEETKPTISVPHTYTAQPVLVKSEPLDQTFQGKNTVHRTLPHTLYKEES